MDGLLTVLFLSAVICLVLVPLMAKWGAQKWRKDHSQDWQTYQNLTGHFRHLKGEIEQMADEWPMFARPVLYTPQDHHAQIEFAHAQVHIVEACELIPKITRYRLDPDRKNKNMLLALTKNIFTIWEARQFRGNIRVFHDAINRILEIKEEINKDREINRELQKSTDQKLKLLEERIGKVEQVIESVGRTNDDVLWARALAGQSLEAAVKSLGVQTDDGLEYAVADILFRIGADILDYLELYIRGLQEERFQLDEFACFRREAYQYLTSALEINELKNWKTVRQADNLLKILPHKLKKAESSLRRFEILRTEFMDLELIVKSYDLDRAIRRASNLQKECEHYWYPHHQRPEFWKKALGDQPLPLKTILNLKNEYLAQIQCITRNEQQLRQSDLPCLLVGFKHFIDTYVSANWDIQSLQRELRRHKDAHVIVRKRIADDGEANCAIQKSIRIISDTEPDIKSVGRAIVQTYENYVEIVQNVTGANFPELIDKLAALIENSNSLEVEHTQMMLELRKELSTLSHMLSNYLEEIKGYIEGFPKVNDPICELLLAARKDGRSILQNLNLTSGYTHLNQSQSFIQDWLDRYEYQISNTRNQKSAFDLAYAQAKVELSGLDGELKTREILNQFTWRWAKTEIQQAIENAQTKLQEQWRYWNMNELQEWRMLYLSDAAKFCNDIYENVGLIKDEFKENVARAAREENELIQIRKGIMRVINIGKKHKATQPEEEKFAEQLCNSAQWAGSKTDAKIALDIAQKTIRRLASPEDYHQGQTIINNIDTGGGAYFAAGVTMGNNNVLVGRDYSFRRGRKHEK